MRIGGAATPARHLPYGRRAGQVPKGVRARAVLSYARTRAGEHRSEAPAHRDAYGFKLEGKVDWATYSSWLVCDSAVAACEHRAARRNVLAFPARRLLYILTATATRIPCPPCPSCLAGGAACHACCVHLCWQPGETANKSKCDANHDHD